ncbi:MAG: hypothetical protein J6A95_03325 [Clostridia bacterium]|nr:hypothetical protein [Clostridia bacterium]
MKRIISIVLLTAMMLTMLAFLSGCKKKIETGTEAAKLLLANERLDSKVLSKIDLGLDGTKVVNLNSGTPMIPSSESDYMRLSDSLGVHYTWTEFENHSHSMVEFTQFMKSIEGTVEDVASDIERMKSKVGVTDKWVDGGFLQNEEHMLRVYENMDMLIIKKLNHNALYVCTRYTNENAKNVYEIFSFYQYDDGDSARMKLLYVPGERYEWASQHANGFSDYFIAENSRGYWIATRYDVRDQAATFWPLIIKDGLGYGGTVYVSKPEYANERLVGHVITPNGLSIGPVSVFDPASNRELFRLTDGGDYGLVEVYFTAIKSGFVSVSTNEARLEDAEESIYVTGNLNKLVTDKGEYEAIESDKKGEFFYNGGYVQHYYGDDFDYGTIQFKINYEDSSKTLSDYILSFGEYVSSLGLELYGNMQNVKASLFHATEYCQNFDNSFDWNGYEMSSYENAQNAKQTFLDATDTALGYYEEVKDFPKAETKQRLSKDAKFADIANLVMGENTYRDGKITVSNVLITITDTALFEAGLDYTLKLGLALCDSEGNPISVNTVVLKSDNEKVSKYSGGEMVLSAGGNFEMPKNLSQGDYALVVYASTKDGIRVSEMEKLAFVEISEGKLSSTAMDIEITNIDNSLHATYTIKNERRISMEATKDSYSYTEVRRAIMQEILAYGYPDSEATLQYENGTEVDTDATLGKGTYRMIAYLNTSDGLAQSYVYLTIN